MRYPGFIGPSYQNGRSVNIDCQRCINLYPEKNELGTGKEGEQWALLSTPGLLSKVVLPTSPIRGMVTGSDGNLYAVGGNKFYRVSSSYAATELGTLVSSSGTVSFADNGLQLMIVDGANGYYWSFGTTSIAQVDTIAVNSLTGVPGHVYTFTINGTAISYTSVTGDAEYSILSGLKTSMANNNVDSTAVLSGTGSAALLTITANDATIANTYTAVDSQLTQANTVAKSSIGPSFNNYTDSNFVGSNQALFLDGYFIFNKPLTKTFYISGLYDVTLDPLDIGTKEGAPDNIVGMIVFNREIWLMGEETLEIFYNAGDANFPFVRVQGAFIEIGCAARFSIAKSERAVFWLGKSDRGTGVVYMAQGPNPQKISTFPVEQAIQGYSDFSDAVAFVYQQEGHDFYVLNFPTANTTWVYDITNGFWHERAYTNNGVLERHRANYHAFCYGTHLVGDYATGAIYELSLSTYTDDGAYITRRRVSPHATAIGKRVSHREFQLDMEVGVGLDGSGQGTDPQAILDFSDDGGHSWNNERWAAIGAIGKRFTRVIWNRLGMTRDRVYRVTITDPVKVALIGANIDIEGEAS